MEADLNFDLPLHVAWPLVAAMPGAGRLHVGGRDGDHRRLAPAHASAGAAGQQARGRGERPARPQGRGRERRAARQQRRQHPFGVAHDRGPDRPVRRRRHRLRHGDRRHPGGDLRRGDAQDLGAAARRPGRAGPRAVDRRHPQDPGAHGPRRRLDLAHLAPPGRRAHRSRARRRRTCRGAARRHRAARHRPDRRGRAAGEGDAALGARPRRPHRRRRHDPSRQRRA